MTVTNQYTNNEDWAANLAARRAKVVELTAQGLGLYEIADRCGVSYRTVSRDRKACGITQPANLPWTDAEQDRALSMLNDGASLAEVMRTLGRDHNTIVSRFKGMGWTGEQTAQYNAMREYEKRMLG